MIKSWLVIEDKRQRFKKKDRKEDKFNKEDKFIKEDTEFDEVIIKDIYKKQ